MGPFLVLLLVCWSGQYVDGQEGITLALNNMNYTNNSVVNITDIGTGAVALICTTTLIGCCLSTDGSHWYFPDGSTVQRTGTTYYRTRTLSHIGGGAVRLNRNPGATTTGVFHCDIPGASGDLQSLYVGIYTATTGSPSVTGLVYNNQSRTLTCTSTGGPATTVTWRRDGAVITLNTTYQQTKRVVDPVSGTYQTLLTIDPTVGQIVGTYNCTVENVRGRSSTTVAISNNVLVSVTAGENPTLGQPYTLTCNVSVASGVTGTPTVQWMGPGNSTPITTGGDFTVANTSSTSYILTINPLHQSHAGQYTCQATVGGDTGTDLAIVDIPAPIVSTSITSPTGPFTVGQSYTLTCTANVTGAGTMSTTTITWLHPNASVTSVTGSSLILSLNPLRVSDAGQYTCNVSVSSAFLTRAQSSTDTFTISVHVPSPTVFIDFATPGAVTYAGNSVTLNCGISLLGGVTDSDVTVSSRWTKDGAPFSGVSGRVTLTSTTRLTSTTYFTQLMFSLLSSSMDNGTYMCNVTLTPRQPVFITGTDTSNSMNLAVQVPTLTVTLTPNTTRLPNVAPYNTFSLTCTATSRVGGGNVALPKRFTWRRRYGPDTTGLTQLSSNATIQIQDGDNLTQPTSSSMLTVTEDIPRDYRYRCRVDLDLPADNIFNFTDVYPITVTGPSSPLQPSNLMSTDVRHNAATIQWTVSMIAYTPENYTMHFGNSPGSLTPFSQQRQSGDNFTATNLQFSIELTGLSAGTTYYYQVVAVNSVGSNQSTMQQFRTNELPPTPPRMFRITSVMTRSLSFSWQMPMTLNGNLTGYQLSCQPLLSGIPLPQPLTPGPNAVMETLSGVYPGVRYNCSIVVRNSAGPSDPVYISGSTLETAPTGAPQSFTVTPGARNMTFSWSPPAPTQRNGVITGYSLSCVPETGGGNIISMQYTAAGTFTLGGFTPATSYNCSIFARNSQGSGPAVYMAIRTLDASPGAPPQNIMVALIADFPEMLFFSWQPPPPNLQNGMITEYTIVCTPSGGGQHVEYVNDVSLNATVVMFTPATQYNCAFTASTSAGPGVETVLPVLTLPSSPENVTLTTSSSQLRVTWTIDPPDGLVSSYTIYVTRLERGNTVVTYTSTNTQLLQFDIPNLDPYELVEVSVSASNSAGEGPRSPGVRGRTREEFPGIVSNCPSRWRDLPNDIQVSWAAPQRPNGVVLRYYIILTSYDSRTVVASASTNENATLSVELSNANLGAGIPYTVSIFAENSAGNGTVCNFTDFTNELSPPAPSGVNVTRINDITIRVSWQHLSLVEARGYITYRVMVTPTTGSRRRRQATQEEKVCTLLSPCEVPANESSVIVVGLDRDTSYSVTVMAVNSEGEAGPTSMPISAPRTTISTPAMIDTGTVVGVAVALGAVIIIVIIMGVVIGVLVARNRRYKLIVQQHAVKDQPVKWSQVAGLQDVDITTTQCETYVTVNQGHEYEDVTVIQPPTSEYDIPITPCPAYVPTSKKKSGSIQEDEYEVV